MQLTVGPDVSTGNLPGIIDCRAVARDTQGSGLAARPFGYFGTAAPQKRSHRHTIIIDGVCLAVAPERRPLAIGKVHRVYVSPPIRDPTHRITRAVNPVGSAAPDPNAPKVSIV